MSKISRELEAKIKMRIFYEELERQLKKYPPIAYARYAAYQMKISLNSNLNKVKAPPHRILHSIEANCYYWRPYKDDPVSYNDFAKTMNIYHDNENPFLTDSLHESIDRTFLMLYREQMEIQKTGSKQYIARIWALYSNTASIKHLSNEFKDIHSISIEDWIKLCFITWGIAISNQYSCINIDTFYKNSNLNIPADIIKRFFQLISRTPKQIKDNFSNNLKKTPYIYHFLIRSCFTQYPIIDFGQGRFLAPHTNILLRHSGEGLYVLARECKSFEKEFGHSFQAYIGNIISSLNNTSNILSSKDIEDSQKGKSCDYVFVHNNVTILIECKAALFTAKMFTDNAILNNGSTGKVADGFKQLNATAKDIMEGKFNNKGIDPNNEIIGIVVTFGEIFSVNSDWYFSNFIEKRLKEENLSETPCFAKRKPFAISIETLEFLFMFLNGTKTNTTTL